VWFYVSGGGNNPRSPVPLRQWSHVVGTYNGRKMQIYINGRLDSIYSLDEPIGSSGEPLIMGLHGGAYFCGMMDEVKVYRRTLSPREVHEHYEAGLAALPKPEPIDVDALTGIARAIHDAGGEPLTVDIDARTRVRADLTIPPNVCLRFDFGDRLVVDKDAAVTIRGPLLAPIAHIFAGEGRVIIDSSSIKEAYPQWWGALGDREHDDTDAIQAAVDAFETGGRVFLPRATYKVSRTIHLPSRTVLMSDNATLRGIVDTMIQAPDPMVRTSSWQISHLTLDGMDRGSSGVGIDLTKHSRALIDDVRIVGFDKGVMIDGGGEAAMYNNFEHMSIAACTTALEANGSTIAVGFYDGKIGNVGTAFALNTTNQFVISNTTIEGFGVGIDAKRGDTVHVLYPYFATGDVGIRIAEGVSQCTVISPRYSLVETPIDDQGSDTVLIGVVDE